MGSINTEHERSTEQVLKTAIQLPVTENVDNLLEKK